MKFLRKSYINYHTQNVNKMNEKTGLGFGVRMKAPSVKIALLALFYFLGYGCVQGQEGNVELPSNLGFVVYKISGDKVLNHFNELSKYHLEDLTINSKWQYHLVISSCNLYLGRDSSLYNFNEANRIDPYSTCNAMRTRHNTFVNLLEQGKLTGIESEYIKAIRKATGDSIFSWYLWDLPDFDEYAFIDSCNLKYPSKQLQAKKKATTAISEKIEQRDQKYRSIGDLEKQHVLDQINRDYVDSLYASRGTLSEFEEEEVYQFSMVAHHSEDCDWVYQWTERLIDHQMNGYKGKMLLDQLLDRMLHPNNGYCTKQDAQKRAYFIYMIEDKYPGFLDGMHLSW